MGGEMIRCQPSARPLTAHGRQRGPTPPPAGRLHDGKICQQLGIEVEVATAPAPTRSRIEDRLARRLLESLAGKHSELGCSERKGRAERRRGHGWDTMLTHAQVGKKSSIPATPPAGPRIFFDFCVPLLLRRCLVARKHLIGKPAGQLSQMVELRRERSNASGRRAQLDDQVAIPPLGSEPARHPSPANLAKSKPRI